MHMERPVAIKPSAALSRRKRRILRGECPVCGDKHKLSQCPRWREDKQREHDKRAHKKGGH